MQTQSEPAELSFTLRRLSIRDELVFKSVMRVLIAQTNQKWVYTDELDASVLVLGSEIAAAYIEPIPDKSLFKAILTINALSTGGKFHLSLPLRVGEVKDMLNRIGAQLLGLAEPAATAAPPFNAWLSTEAVPRFAPAPQGEPANPAAVTTRAPLTASLTAPPTSAPTAPQPAQRTASQAATAQMAAQWPANAMVLLLRWPPQTLMKAHPGHPKLAALITGRPSTAERMAELSGVSVDVCRAFCLSVVRFEAAKIVAQLPAPQADSASPLAPVAATTKPTGAAPTRGLLAMIRARLGLGAKT